MNVSCPSCKTRYSVDDSRVPPTGVTIRCPKCSHTFVAKRPEAAPRGASAVPLPGSVAARTPPAAPPAPASRPASAVPLPGSVAPPVQKRVPPPAAHTDPEMDLGLEDTPPPMPAVTDLPVPRGAHPTAASVTDLPGPRKPALNAPPAAPGPSIGNSGLLDFIDDTAQRAGRGPVEPTTHIEYKLRRRNGRVEGPFGVNRIVTMLRNKELGGTEDISEDGVSWRAMTSHPEINPTINELAAAADDQMSYGQVELPVPQGMDLPGHRNMPGNRAPAAGLDLQAPASAPRAAPLRAPAPSSGPMGGVHEDLDLDHGDEAPPPKRGRPSPPREDPSEELPPLKAPGDALEVGEIPELPPLWQTYRKPILGFVGVMAAILVGVFTQLFTPYGAFGIPGLVDAILKEPPPAVPAKPPPPPPKLADPEQVAALIDEGAYEAFRSVFATIDKAGPTLPDNMLAAAKARGFATLAYGTDEFPLADLTAAVEALNTVDLAKALGGNAAQANVEILKARSALEIVNGSAASAATQLSAIVEQRADDKELAHLLGLARAATKDTKGALEALDRAIVDDARYAPALHAIGEVVRNAGEEASAADAAAWFEKALLAEPSHGRSGLAAAELYDGLHQQGARRRALAAAAATATQGLPPSKRAEVLYTTAVSYDGADRLAEAADLALEAARLDPGNNTYVALSAVALALQGKALEGLAAIEPVLRRSPTDVEALISRARIYTRTEDIAKGFLDLEAARAAAPRDYRVPLWEARFNLQLAKLNDARTSLERAIRLSESSPEPHVEMGRLDLSLGDVDSAFGHAQDAVKLAPNDTRAHVLLGDAFNRRGQIDQSLETYRKALDLDDENLAARLGYANAHRDKGARSANPSTSKDLAEAIPLYLQALRDHPNDPQVMFEYGRALELQGNIDSALALYAEAAAIDEKDVRPHLKMVAAQVDRGQPDLARAKASLIRAQNIEMQSGRQSTEVRFWEARVALLEGTPEKLHDAVSSMRQAVEAEPKSALYAYWLGRVLEQNQSLYEAITYYERAVTLNSRLALAHRALGAAAVERHQFEKARASFGKYREAQPDDPTIWVDIGESYTRENRDDEAMAAFQTAIKSEPKLPQALLQIGNILSRKGKEKDAAQYFRRAANMDPKLGEAWCQLGISESRTRVSKETRQLLERCLALPNSPSDMKLTAESILETAER